MKRLRDSLVTTAVATGMLWVAWPSLVIQWADLTRDFHTYQVRALGVLTLFFSLALFTAVCFGVAGVWTVRESITKRNQKP